MQEPRAQYRLLASPTREQMWQCPVLSRADKRADMAISTRMTQTGSGQVAPRSALSTRADFERQFVESIFAGRYIRVLLRTASGSQVTTQIWVHLWPPRHTATEKRLFPAPLRSLRVDASSLRCQRHRVRGVRGNCEGTRDLTAGHPTGAVFCGPLHDLQEEKAVNGMVKRNLLSCD